MKKFIIIVGIFLFIVLLMACGKSTDKMEKDEIKYIDTIVRKNDSGEKVIEIIKFVKNDQHFDFIKDVKLHTDEKYNDILEMSEQEYFDIFDNAANITYPLGKIYLFHLRDINRIGSIMMKAVNIKGKTIDDPDRDYDAKYLVATCGNYLIVGIGKAEDSDEVKDTVDIFEKYFGKDSLENIYNLLLKV